VGKRKLRFPEGDEYTLELAAVRTAVDPDNPTQLTTVPVDLTGATITLYRKTSVSLADNHPSVVTENGVVTDGPNGQYEVTVTSEMLSPAGLYVYKVVAVKAGVPMTLLHGELLAEDT
jgi:hypothetical protein